ncbi:phosphatidylinositol phosphate synthase [Rhizomonospora bruguierae]|uniref:phosphatidylinositol phosphate synthase n=1 Tax=Rhizomonospora bruguierae TaxID=1581705 RepID=UPI001BCBEA63|nr:CDP-alcohol phosphatidyltransferase family protein [Micromonospora sp. NBRC 107566]
MAKIFSGSARAAVNRVFDPVARVLLRAGVSPDAVTVFGTVGLVASAIVFGARGHFVIGAFVVTAFAFTDLIDGTMARMRGGSRRFGALLDSTMDRIADGATFGAVCWWYATHNDRWTLLAALLCLVSGQIISYVKARGEGLGFSVNVGVAERAERLVLLGIGGLLTGWNIAPWGLPAALWILAALSFYTIWQRLVHVYRADRAAVAADPSELP